MECPSCNIPDHKLLYQHHTWKNGDYGIAAICPECSCFVAYAPKREPYLSRVSGEYLGKKAAKTKKTPPPMKTTAAPAQTRKPDFFELQLIMDLQAQLNKAQETLNELVRMYESNSKKR